MECMLPPDAFVAAGHRTSSGGEDLTRCVLDAAEDEMTPSKEVNQTPTPLAGDGSVVPNSSAENDRNSVCYQSPGTPKLSRRPVSPSLIEPVIDDSKCKSPRMSMQDRVRKRQNLLSSTMRLDVSHLGEESVLLNERDDTDDVPMSGAADPLLTASMHTPLRSSQRDLGHCGGLVHIPALRNKDIYVNVSDDVVKNPILAKSVRSIRMNVPLDQDDVERSRRVLGASRCWTDKFDENGHELPGIEEDEDYDDILATQTPIRSLTTLVPTPRYANVYGSGRGMAVSRAGGVARNASPIGTPQRSVGAGTTASTTPNRYTQTMFATGDAMDLDAFGGARIEDMRKDDVNPMVYATLGKGMISESRMGTYLSLLYKHFKNMCTFIRRASMRSDRPYFKVVQLMVQRMTRKDFTLDHLRQIAWLAPNLVTLKSVSIAEPIRKRYKTEYSESRGDHVSDVQIRIHKLDGRLCSSTNDFENTCYCFKSIICAWIARCKAEYVQDRGSCCGFDPDMSLPIPLAALPTKHCGGLGTDDAIPLPISTPTRPAVKLSRNVATDATQSTALFTSNNRSDRDFGHLSTTKMCYSPVSDIGSIKRLRDETMLPVSTDLLDTPGMWRIRENAKRVAAATNTSYVKERDISYWKDVRRFLNALVDLSISDERPPLLRLDWLAEFMSKHGTGRATYDNVADWANTLATIAPDVINVGISKFDDYSTVLTLRPQPMFDNAIRYVDQQINTCNK
ncbi:uncharacterized protein BXIN_0523 [Babesia sp. Xinjiang]|uniref:uncharacterized protein n=1 Tax=Babesia sp. Xinjiang TaxID=462227 RepID=UPI000A215D84|nr:uncharacterized protein BXIN_0523 [Babesia sp. Xinjiang]ORM41902.1 hypothetical protein BXIN_0523 [Babesia sp. Xinjiang]